MMHESSQIQYQFKITNQLDYVQKGKDQFVKKVEEMPQELIQQTLRNHPLFPQLCAVFDAKYGKVYFKSIKTCNISIKQKGRKFYQLVDPNKNVEKWKFKDGKK